MNPVFNCSNNLSSSSVDKATTGAYSFLSFISNIAFVWLLTTASAGSASGSAYLVSLLAIIEFLEQVK